MTATLALPPVLAAALTNRLCNVAVFNGVPPTHRCPLTGESLMPCCGRSPFDVPIDHRITADPRLGTCGGSGTVAPSVEPGQRIAIAAVGDLPDDRIKAFHRVLHPFRADAGLWPDDPSGCDKAWCRSEIPRLAASLHTGCVVGSAVATTPALPIVDASEDSGDAECLYLDLERGWLRHMPASDAGFDGPNWGITNLDAALPWLPSDLVGRWAVLVEDAATTEQRCPRCNGGRVLWDDMGAACPVCDFTGVCPPVPLPDGVDPEPYTLTELELTDG